MVGQRNRSAAATEGLFYCSYLDELHAFWNHMLASEYGTFTDHSRYIWQFRPKMSVRGSMNANDNSFDEMEQFLLIPGNKLLESKVKMRTSTSFTPKGFIEAVF